MILSPKQRELLADMLEDYILGLPPLEKYEGLMNDLRPMCPKGMSLKEFLQEVARTGRTDPLSFELFPISAADKEQFDSIIAQKIPVPLSSNIDKYAAIPPDASGMREVQARIRQIIKAEPSSGIYMLMLKCYDDPVCKRWYKTSPWLLRIQITNAIRAIIDAEEADVLAFLAGSPVAPSDF